LKRSVPFKFIHCADLHLATPFEGMFDKVPPAIGLALQDATFRAFDKVVQAAVLHQVDFVVIAGDIYDGVRHSTRAQIKFAEALEELTGQGIKCLIAHGNHDPLEAWRAQYSLPNGVHRFGFETVECVPVAKEGKVIANIYGISHAVFNVEENLAKRFKHIDKSIFSVGVLHCNVGKMNDDRYAPCSLEDLRQSGLDYWALGHVHTKSVLSPEQPCVIYPGNTQGVSIRETGPRGCYLIEVDEHGKVTPIFISTEVIRWEKAECNIAGMEQLNELIASLHKIKDDVRRAAEGRGTILRIGLVGRGTLDKALRGTSKAFSLNLESDLIEHLRQNEDTRTDFVWLESIAVNTRPEIDLEIRRKAPDFVGDFLRRSAEVRQSIACLNPLDKRQELKKVISGYLGGRPEFNKISFILEDMADDELFRLLEEAETIGLNLLVDGEEI